MKKLFWIILFLPSLLSAQQLTPLFQTTIYLEDTLGNRDSVIIGYDENEQQNFVNPNFGEVDITNVPWDSVFEARVMPYSAFENVLKQSKKQIEYYPCDQYLGMLYTIAIRLTTPFSPLIIRWESTDFSSDLCRTGSFIVESPMYFSEPNPQGYGQVYLMNGSTYGTSWAADGAKYQFNAFDESGNQVLINTFVFVIAKNYPISTHSQILQQQTKVFPNPTTEAFTITLPENYYSESVKVFDVTGRTIYESTEKSNKINVPSVDWAKGIYFYQVRLEDGFLVSGKVLRD
jgi:hypothetical protein